MGPNYNLCKSGKNETINYVIDERLKEEFFQKINIELNDLVYVRPVPAELPENFL